MSHNPESHARADEPTRGEKWRATHTSRLREQVRAALDGKPLPIPKKVIRHAAPTRGERIERLEHICDWLVKRAKEEQL